MRAAMLLKARSVLAVSVFLIAIAMFFMPVAASAQVTIFHVRMTIKPKTGHTGTTAVYCDTGTACTGGSPQAAGLQLWTLGSGIHLNGNETLVLSQTGLAPGTAFPNFDTSDRVPQTQGSPAQLLDCNNTGLHGCEVVIQVDTGSGLVQVYDSGAGDDPIVNSNVDTGFGDHCEGTASYTNHPIAPTNYLLGTGYVDNVHSCNVRPTPFTTATHFTDVGNKGVGAEETCTSDCYDAGAIIITGVQLSQGCTYTWGFWKNHGPEASGNNSNVWPPFPGPPAGTLKLGTVAYTAAQLQSIFDTPVGGNGLISLAHQLIAAKLAILSGANPAAIQATITAADAFIGGSIIPPVGSATAKPKDVSDWVDTLTAYNTGTIGPGHCADEVVVN